jgi:cell fate (sporulation/competence/biofilm development) regulator YlbF (YheA/YmcA/DUF963 family)
MTKKQREVQSKLEALLRAKQIKEKEKKMQTRTGASRLSSSYDRIQSQLQHSLNHFGYVLDVNKSMTFQDPDHLEAA